MDNKSKEFRFKYENLTFREEGEAESSKMIIEGYPIVFDQEAYIESWEYVGYEKIDRHAFDNCDMSDVALKYNHNDNVLILARTRSGSLKLTIDDHGVFIHAELIDTTDCVDVYKMVKAGLLTEGSFAFFVEKDEITKGDDGAPHRTILEISYLADVAICPNGAYGSLTEIYARNKQRTDVQAKADAEKRCGLLRLKNSNKLKIMEVKSNGD